MSTIKHTLKEWEEGSSIYYCTVCGKAEIELSEPCERRKRK